jgi:hypothetical protein
MSFTARLIDVGMDEARRSHLDNIETITLVPGQDRDIWQSFEATSSGVPFYPEPDSTLFRFFVLPPPDETLSQTALKSIADQFFAQNNIEHCRIDTSRNPFMHATPTSDCVMLLSGRVQLLLDSGVPVDLKPFDVIRQRETNHSWINLGPGPAVLISLMHGLAKT